MKKILTSIVGISTILALPSLSMVKQSSPQTSAEGTMSAQKKIAALKESFTSANPTTQTHWGFVGDEKVTVAKDDQTLYHCSIGVEMGQDKPNTPDIFGKKTYNNLMTIQECEKKFKETKNSTSYHGNMFWIALKASKKN